MKSEEFVDEGVGSWLKGAAQTVGSEVYNKVARGGWLGSKRQTLAYAKKDLALKWPLFFQEFYSELALHLNSKKASLQESTIKSYKQFSHIIESIILNEAAALSGASQTVEKVVLDFILTKLLDEKPPRQPSRDQIQRLMSDDPTYPGAVKRFADAYRAAGMKLSKPIAEILARAYYELATASGAAEDMANIATGVAPAPAPAATLGDDAPPNKGAWDAWVATSPSAPTGGSVGPQPIIKLRSGPGFRTFQYDWTGSVWVDITSPSSPAKVDAPADVTKLNAEYNRIYNVP